MDRAGDLGKLRGVLLTVSTTRSSTVRWPGGDRLGDFSKLDTKSDTLCASFGGDGDFLGGDGDFLGGVAGFGFGVAGTRFVFGGGTGVVALLGTALRGGICDFGLVVEVTGDCLEFFVVL